MSKENDGYDFRVTRKEADDWKDAAKGTGVEVDVVKKQGDSHVKTTFNGRPVVTPLKEDEVVINVRRGHPGLRRDAIAKVSERVERRRLDRGSRR